MEFDASKLNEAQKSAMMDTEGAVLVLAGAGSGKTRVLTHRVAYLVQVKNIMAYNILAITFTNKATQEMKERLKVLLGDDNKVWISTFHSLCSYILKTNAESLVGYDKNFSIYDESDSMRTIKKALREKNLDGSSIKDSIKYHISKAKNKGLTPDQYYAEIKGVVKDADAIYDLYVKYEELLKASNAMDFDDLLYKTKALFEYAPAVLEKYQRRFRYIHVDEFQDTNAVQFELVQMLSAKWGNLFVVGDDDQSIYGWRGADVKNILNFEQLFPGTKVHKLLQNYRSTGKILEAANNVIRHNTQRHEKELFTNQGVGVRVEYHTAYNDYQEADWVADTIVNLKRNNGYTNKDFAILVRANALSRLFENKLSTLRMKYQVLGGFRFFDRKEIQDVIAYMRVINNMRDTEAIERVINFPRRGIGDTTIDKLGQTSREKMLDLMDIIINIKKYNILNASAEKKVEEFSSVIMDIYNNRGLPLNQFVDYLIERAGFEFCYNSTGKEDDINRWENIQEFRRHINEYVVKKPDATLDEFLQTLTLVPEKNDETAYDDEIVTIATMHAVKGLEFKVVFIVGCEEEVFPAVQSIKEGDVEEERRVMYVAITRAEERLYICYAIDRFRYNKHQNNPPSRFIDEAKGGSGNISQAYERQQEYAEKKKAYGEKYNADFAYDAVDFSPRKLDVGKAAVAHTMQPQQKVVNRDTSSFKSGDKVKHPIYGEGTIILILGQGAETTATVVFPQLGVKKFKLALAPITLVK